MTAPDTLPLIARLRNPALLREACFVDGQWLPASKASTVHVI